MPLGARYFQDPSPCKGSGLFAKRELKEGWKIFEELSVITLGDRATPLEVMVKSNNYAKRITSYGTVTAPCRTKMTFHTLIKKLKRNHRVRTMALQQRQGWMCGKSRSRTPGAQIQLALMLNFPTWTATSLLFCQIRGQLLLGRE
jgi:hypothetical protein